MKINKRILGGLFGVAVGDALGVPVEFVSREDLRKAGYQCEGLWHLLPTPLSWYPRPFINRL